MSRPVADICTVPLGAIVKGQQLNAWLPGTKLVDHLYGTGSCGERDVESTVATSAKPDVVGIDALQNKGVRAGEVPRVIVDAVSAIAEPIDEGIAPDLRDDGVIAGAGQNGFIDFDVV